LKTRWHDDLAALSNVHDFFESFSKFGIENRVDDGINEAVHVSAEREEASLSWEGGRVLKTINWVIG
jgi:hypothetical protein